MNGGIIEKNGEKEIDLKRLFQGLLKKAWLIGLASLVCGLAVLGGTILFVTPKYESSAMFYVNNSSVPMEEGAASISSGDISASRGLVKSYIVILNSKESLDGVIEHAEVDCTYEELKKMITAEVVDSTEFFRVVVTSTDPEEAERIADAISYILPKRIAGIIEGTSAQLVDFAMAKSEPDSPDYVKNTVIGFALGLILSVGAVALWIMMDNTIRTPEDVKQCCSYPILAVIPDRKRPAQIGKDLRPGALETYKRLRTKLRYSLAEQEQPWVIGLTSPVTSAGKSLMAVNLAWSLSRLGKTGILIDCDLCSPALAETLKCQPDPGLSEFLTGRCELDRLIQPCGISEEEAAFYVVTAGERAENANELLSGEQMRSFLKELRSRYDYVLLDLPPVAEVSDAQAVAGDSDGFLLVVRQDQCSCASLTDAVEQLEFVDASILGLVYSGAAESKRKHSRNNK